MIDFVRKITDYYIKKNRNGGSPSPAEFNRILRLAQLNVIKHSLKEEGFETYSIIRDEISVLKRTSLINVSSATFPKPTDFMYLMRLENYVTGTSLETYDVDMVDSKAYNYRRTSSIVMPETDHPIAESFNTNWKVLPETITSIRCTYIKQPSDPVWAYTGTRTYDEANSTDVELPESMLTELCLEVLQQMGVNVRESQIINYANQLKKDE